MLGRKRFSFVHLAMIGLIGLILFECSMFGWKSISRELDPRSDRSNMVLIADGSALAEFRRRSAAPLNALDSVTLPGVWRMDSPSKIECLRDDESGQAAVEPQAYRRWKAKSTEVEDGEIVRQLQEIAAQLHAQGWHVDGSVRRLGEEMREIDLWRSDSLGKVSLDVTASPMLDDIEITASLTFDPQGRQICTLTRRAGG